jgi:DNA replication licensing factor MCM2
VIAAANPLRGTYNHSLSFVDNVDLTDPILSRFDILSVIKDEVNEETDDALATFVINSHIKSHPEVQADLRPSLHQNEDLDENLILRKNATLGWLS